MEQMKIGGEVFTWGTRTYLMGILNATPDSFSDGGKYVDPETAAEHALSMLREGADIIDVGGESTRPGAAPVDTAEEIRRVVPLISRIAGQHGIPISIDTYHAKTAEEAIVAGAGLINDIWGLKADPEMASVAAQYGVPVCIMHNRKSPDYVNLIEDMKRDLDSSINIALKAGVKNRNIILDPGIGFGKTYEHNIVVLSHLEDFGTLGYPLLLGVSRKSVIGLTLNLPVEDRLEGTIAANVAGILKGADIIRVHDVRQNKRAAAMADALVRNL